MTTKRPPKTIPNPEFAKSKEVRDEIEEAIRAKHAMLGAIVSDHENPFALLDGMNCEIWSALPERGRCEIPEDGAWVIVKKVPNTELEDRFDVPLLSIWRARPTYRNQEYRLGGKGRGRRATVRWPCLLGIINTPGGELWLYPGEYITTNIDVWLDFVGRGLDVHFLGAGEPGDFGQQLFYLMAHGIRRAEAMLLLLPNLTDQNFCYFTLGI